MNIISRFILSVIATGICLAAVPEALGQEDIRADPARMEERIRALSQFGANPEGGVSRVAFSDADLEGRAYIRKLMRDAGLDVRVGLIGPGVAASHGVERTHREGIEATVQLCLGYLD